MHDNTTMKYTHTQAAGESGNSRFAELLEFIRKTERKNRNFNWIHWHLFESSPTAGDGGGGRTKKVVNIFCHLFLHSWLNMLFRKMFSSSIFPRRNEVRLDYTFFSNRKFRYAENVKKKVKEKKEREKVGTVCTPRHSKDTVMNEWVWMRNGQGSSRSRGAVHQQWIFSHFLPNNRKSSVNALNTPAFLLHQLKWAPEMGNFFWNVLNYIEAVILHITLSPGGALKEFYVYITCQFPVYPLLLFF